MKFTGLNLLSIIWLIALCAVVDSCHTKKDVQRDVSAATDSVGTSASHRSLAMLDSVAARFDFRFDTLTITVERPLADTTEIVRLRAVRGQIVNIRTVHKTAVEVKTRLDSTAYKISASDKSAEHTATTVAYEPPKMTIVFCVSVAVALLLLFLYFKRK